MTQFPSHWSAETKIIEIGVTHDTLSQWLFERGYTNYLGVSHDSQLVEQLQAASLHNGPQYTHAEHAQVVLQNNADCLILSGSSTVCVWNYRRVRHARQVAINLSLQPMLLIALLGWLLRLLVGQYRKPQLVTCTNQSGRKVRLLVTEVGRLKRCFNSARHFIPHRLGVTGFLAELDRQQIRYVILRWFDQLQTLKPSSDLDLLFADQDHARVMALLESGPGIQKCDTYTPSGLPQTEYAGVSYYPPPMANRLLKNAVRSEHGWLVPNSHDYFHSLAYHAVMHKGPKSGLPGAEHFKKAHHRASRDFTPILKGMSEKLGIEVEVTLSGMYAYLQGTAWAPPADLIARLAAGCPKNRWLAQLAREQSASNDFPELSVFIIRHDAQEKGYTELIQRMLREGGFELLATKQLSPVEIERGALCTRGGNWGPGAGFRLGGLPAAMVIAYDPQPLPLSRQQQKRFPLVTNARQFLKEQIRDTINAELPPDQAMNALHSSDYAAEAEHFIEVFAPELKSNLRERLCGEAGSIATVRRAA